MRKGPEEAYFARVSKEGRTASANSSGNLKAYNHSVLLDIMRSMKVSRGALITSVLIVGVIGFGSYRWYMAKTVFANEALTSDFYRTYDPGPVLRKYGAEISRGNIVSSGSGWGEATRTREITANVSLAAGQVEDLTAALQKDIDMKLRAQGRVIGSGQDSGEASYEYESRHAWGFFILERIEPERTDGVWRVRMRMIERCHK